MATVMLSGFQCDRCGHQWIPRADNLDPRICPKCKSPYWNRPRKNDVKPEHKVTVAWAAHELDGRTVEISVLQDGKKDKRPGFLSASDLGDGSLRITVTDARDSKKAWTLKQSEAESIKTHPGEYRFKCDVAG